MHNNGETLYHSYQNILTFYKEIQSLDYFWENILSQHGYIRSNRRVQSGGDPHFFTSTNNNKKEYENWITRYFAYVYVKDGDDPRRPEHVIFFYVDTDVITTLHCDETFMLYFGTLPRTFLEYVEHKQHHFWNYNLLFARSTFTQDEIILRRQQGEMRSPIQSISLFADQQHIEREIHNFITQIP
jgi:hypothetical protein